MKKLLLTLCVFTLSAFAQTVTPTATVTKTPAPSNEIRESLVIGPGKSLTATGNGVVAATSAPWDGVTGKPTLVNSVAGRTGAVTLTSSDLTDTNAFTRGLLAAIDAAAFRSAIGLPASATTDTTNASNITSGTLPNARLSAVPNSALANSTFTITAGTGLSGGGSVALGGNVTLSNAGVTSISGTAGQVNASGSTGNVTLSLPSTITQATTFSGGLGWSGGSVLSTSSGILRLSNGRQFDISGSASSLTILDATGGVAPLTLNTTIGTASVGYTTASTSTTTGALVVSGGVGVAGSIYNGGFIFNGTGTNNIQIDGSNRLALFRTSADANMRLTRSGVRDWDFFGGTNLRVVADGGSDLFTLTSAGVATFASNVASTGGSVEVSRTGANDAFMRISADAGRSRNLSFNTAGARRWIVAASSTAESGSNAGSDFTITRYSDADAGLGTALTITRSTGDATFSGNLTASGGSITGGASGLTLNAGGTNQNITLTPSGTGATVSTARALFGAAALANTPGFFGIAAGSDTTPALGFGNNSFGWGFFERSTEGNFKIRRLTSGAYNDVLTFERSTGKVTVDSTTASTSTSTGALTVAGGLGVAGAVNTGAEITIGSTDVRLSRQGAGILDLRSAASPGTTGRLDITGTAYAGLGLRQSGSRDWFISAESNELLVNGLTAGSTAAFTSNVNLAVRSTTASTSTTTGALTVSGGVGVNGAVFSTSSEVTNSQNSTTSYTVRNANTGTLAAASLIATNSAYSGGFTLGGTGASNVGPFRANRGMLSAPFDLNYLSGAHVWWVGSTGAGNDPSTSTEIFRLSTTTSGAKITHTPQNSSQGGTATVGVGAEWKGATLTNNTAAASSTVASQVWHSWGTPAFAASNSNVTITDAATMYVQPPVPGTNATLTNRYAIWTAAGGSIKTEGGLIVGSTGTWVRSIHSASASLDFPSVSANSESTLTVTVTGATVGDVVSLGWSAALDDGIVVKQYWVSATDTVSIRVRNVTGGSIDPAAQSVRVTVTRH